MKVLITGASGFLGRNLVLNLPKNWKIIATYLNDNTFPSFITKNGLDNVVPIKIDLSSNISFKSVDDYYKSYDVCVFLAANGDPAYSEEEPVIDLKSNTISLLNTVQHWTFEKFLFFSSGAVYDHLTGNVSPDSFISPTLPYAISKYASERYMMQAQKHGKIKFAAAIRFFGAYGPYEPNRKIYGKLIKQFGIDKNKNFTIKGNGKNLIDAMYIEDLVHAVKLLIHNLSDSKILDLYSGNSISIEDLVIQTAKLFNINPNIKFEGNVPEFIEFKSSDTTMADNYGFKPQIPLNEGLIKFYNWIVENNE